MFTDIDSFNTGKEITLDAQIPEDAQMADPVVSVFAGGYTVFAVTLGAVFC
jgi:hypothetical protein